MSSVFVTQTADPDSEAVEENLPLARIVLGGVYFFLYPAILQLRDQTGELIDPQTNAFFIGSTLDHLQAFLVASRSLATGQPETWQQRVGTNGAKGEVLYQTTKRHDVLHLLGNLEAAVQRAREQHLGVFFMGE